MGILAALSGFLYFSWISQLFINKSESLMLYNKGITPQVIHGRRFQVAERGISSKMANRNNLAMITDKLNRRAIFTASLANSGDSGRVYFSKLLKGRLKKERLDNLTYSQMCEKVKSQIVENYSYTLVEHLTSKFANSSHLFNSNTNLYNKEDDSSKNDKEKEETKENLNTQVRDLGKLYESSIIGTLSTYLEMTNKDEKFPFLKTISLDEKKIRITKMIELLSFLEKTINVLFRNNSYNLKLIYINRFFNKFNKNPGGNKEYDYVASEETNLLNSYKENLNDLVPDLFKVYLYNNGNGLKDNVKALFNKILNEKLIDEDEMELLEQLLHEEKQLSAADWNLDHELNELKLLMKNVKSVINLMKQENSKAAQNQQNLLDTISSQQQKIQQYNKLLNNANSVNRNLACGFSYRIPNTNLTVSSTYNNGVNNIELVCIPDNSFSYLGHNGFVKSLPFGNLGIDFSISF